MAIAHDPDQLTVAPRRRSTGCLVASLVLVVVVLLPVLGYALYAGFTGHAPEWGFDSLACEQPESVTYADGRYEVAAHDPTASLSFGSSDPFVVVGRAGSNGTYGVKVVLNSSTDAARRVRMFRLVTRSSTTAILAILHDPDGAEPRCSPG